MTEDLETSVPTAVRAPSIFRSLVITTLSRVCIMLTMLPNPSPDPDRCSQIHRCLAVPVPTFRLRDSLSECYITGRCLPAMTPRVLVMGDEVRTEENFFRRTITINSFTGRSLSARLPGSLRLLLFPLPASLSGPSCDELSPCEERYGLTLFR
jgi:hypothetical protein